MGLLDRVMDMVFLPNTGSVVVRSSQGRSFCFCCGFWLKKGHIWQLMDQIVLKKMIFGQILSHFIHYLQFQILTYLQRASTSQMQVERQSANRD